jgi:dolichol-phosphate mannosyltransferase
VGAAAPGPGENGPAAAPADVQVSIIIPCLNEEQNIPVVVDKLTALIDATGMTAEILIVDDCSDDYTFREALLLSQGNSNVVALHKGLPRGIGHAIRYAIERARGRVGVVVMGDGVDPIAAIPDFRREVIENGADLVLLSRYLDPGDHANIPAAYRFYQAIYRRLLRTLVGLPFADATYAFRAFSLDYVRGLGLESGGFEISPELTLKTWVRGGVIHELKGRQGRRMAGESKFLFSQQAVGYARVALQAGLEHQRKRRRHAERRPDVAARS